MNKHLTTISRITALTLATTACSGGGGRSTTTPIIVNDGELSVDQFDYTDSRGDRFHPLSTREKCLLDRSEVSLVYSAPDPARQLRVYDDAADGIALQTLSETPATFAQGYELWDLQTANLDDDGEYETIAIGYRADTGEISFLIHDPQGMVYGPVWVDTQAQLMEIQFALGDLDADGRMEMAAIVTYGLGSFPVGHTLLVLDDPVEGFRQLRREISSDYQLRMAMGDMDADGDDELVELRTDIDNTHPTISLQVWNHQPDGSMERVQSMGGMDLAPYIPRGGSHGYESSFTYATLVTGNFDASKGDEVLLVVFDELAEAAYYAAYDGDLSQMTDKRRLDHAGMSVRARVFGKDHGFELQTLDATFERGEELIARWSNNDFNIIFTASIVHYFQVLEDESKLATFLPEQISGEFGPVDIAIGDDDQDGLDEIYLAIQGYDFTSLRRLEVTPFTNPQTGRTEVTTIAQTDVEYSVPAAAGRIQIASGDIDADRTAVRWTGESFLEVADPVPLIIMAAPPTKGGISNVDDTGASYIVSQTQGEQREVSHSYSYSWEGGGGVNLFDDFFSAGYERSMEEEFESNYGSSNFVTEFTSYNGDGANDYVIFHGVLYQRYEYEIVASPNELHIGTTLLINIPVEARQYFWTLDFYNDRVDADARIGDDVLGHEIGDPTSYPRHEDFESLAGTGAEVLWWDPNGQAVSQGPATVGSGVVLGEETTTGGSYSYSTGDALSGGLELKIFEFGGSSTMTHAETSLWSVSLSSETEYSAEVGGIPAPIDYALWNYTWGLGVQNHLGADGRAFQVINFWTAPLGNGYPR